MPYFFAFVSETMSRLTRLGRVASTESDERNQQSPSAPCTTSPGVCPPMNVCGLPQPATSPPFSRFQSTIAGGSEPLGGWNWLRYSAAPSHAKSGSSNTAPDASPRTISVSFSFACSSLS